MLNNMDFTSCPYFVVLLPHLSFLTRIENSSIVFSEYPCYTALHSLQPLPLYFNFLWSCSGRPLFWQTLVPGLFVWLLLHLYGHPWQSFLLSSCPTCPFALSVLSLILLLCSGLVPGISLFIWHACWVLSWLCFRSQFLCPVCSDWTVSALCALCLLCFTFCPIALCILY